MLSFLKKKKPVVQADQSSDIDIQRMKIIKSEIKPYEDIMIGFAASLKEQKNVEDRIEILKALIESYYDLKRKCSSLGHTYAEYFSDTWEHCRNSQNKDFAYIDRFEEELSELLSKKDELIAEQALHEKEKVYLKERVRTIIKNNSPILQKDGRSYIITWMG